MTGRLADGTDRAAAIPRATRVGVALALLSLPILAAATTYRWSIPRMATIGLQWVLLVAVLAVTVLWEDRSLHSIGIRRPEPIDLAYLAVATVLGFLALAATGPIVEALGLTDAGPGGLGLAEAGVGVALLGAVTVGVVEEVLYRGYAIERLEEGTGSVLLAGGLSWAVFTVAHAVSWDLGDLLQVSLAAAVFTAVYLKRRSVVPVVGAHVIIWLFGILGAIYG